MQVGKDRVKGYFLAGFHPASILCLTTPFSIHSVPSCLLCPLAFANGFAVTSVSDRRLSRKWSRPRSAKADQEPQDHLDWPSAFVQRVLTMSRESLFTSALWPGKTRGINYSRSLCFIFGANHYDPGIGRWPPRAFVIRGISSHLVAEFGFYSQEYSRRPVADIWFLLEKKLHQQRFGIRFL